MNGSTKGLQGLGYAESLRSLILPSTKTLVRAFLTTIFSLVCVGISTNLFTKVQMPRVEGCPVQEGGGGGGEISWKEGVEALNCLKHKYRHTLATT